MWNGESTCLNPTFVAQILYQVWCHTWLGFVVQLVLTLFVGLLLILWLSMFDGPLMLRLNWPLVDTIQK